MDVLQGPEDGLPNDRYGVVVSGNSSLALSLLKRRGKVFHQKIANHKKLNRDTG